MAKKRPGFGGKKGCSNPKVSRLKRTFSRWRWEDGKSSWKSSQQGIVTAKSNSHPYKAAARCNFAVGRGNFQSAIEAPDASIVQERYAQPEKGGKTLRETVPPSKKGAAANPTNVSKGGARRREASTIGKKKKTKRIFFLIQERKDKGRNAEGIMDALKGKNGAYATIPFYFQEAILYRKGSRTWGRGLEGTWRRRPINAGEKEREGGRETDSFPCEVSS